MMSNEFEFIHRANNSDGIYLWSKLKINNAHYPNVEMV